MILRAAIQFYKEEEANGFNTGKPFFQHVHKCECSPRESEEEEMGPLRVAH